MPRSSARPRERLRGDRVHLPVRLGVELGRRVVREPGEVDHPIDAVERARGHVANVGHNQLDSVAKLRKRLLAEVEAVEHADAIAPLEQPRHEDAADVAGAPGDEDRALRGRLESPAHPRQPRAARLDLL